MQARRDGLVFILPFKILSVFTQPLIWAAVVFCWRCGGGAGILGLALVPRRFDWH